MNLSQFKDAVNSIQNIEFQFEDGKKVPLHFHITEIGSITKNFIDCGGVVREEHKINIQLWNANDFDHRLTSEKLLKIIDLSENKLHLGNHEIEVEFQGTSIEKYGLDFKGTHFILLNLFTDCLAQDHCGIPENQMPFKVKQSSCCDPKSGCC